MAGKNNPVKPKIKHGTNAGVIVTLVVAVVSNATDQFGDKLGDWATPLGMLLAVAVFSVVGYLKKEPGQVVKNVQKYMDES